MLRTNKSISYLIWEITLFFTNSIIQYSAPKSLSAQDMTYDTPDMDTMPNYEIVKFQCGVSTHSELTILCYGKRFNIQVSAEDLHGNL
jgi:hypothetical protein